MRPRALAIGLGNTLRGDDGVGARVIDRLRGCTDPAGWDLQTCHQLLPEYTEAMRDRETVVFVDASIEIPPGEIAVTEVEADPLPWRWGHQLRPDTLMGMVEPAHRPLRAFTVGIGAADFDFGERLSPAVEAAIDEAIATILFRADQTVN